jgi:hypothetical protein
MTSLQLTLGAGHIDRTIRNPDHLLQQYRQDTGAYYLDYQSTLPKDQLIPEDLAVTLLVNSQVKWQAFRSMQVLAPTIDLSQLPEKSLEETTEIEQRLVAEAIAAMAQWPGFAASVATKVLHKKRPYLIPILDNQAIFGAYLDPSWPEQRAWGDSVKSAERIFQALNWIAFDITRPENEAVWPQLLAIEPNRSRIQLFDSVWWMYFRTVQPVR